MGRARRPAGGFAGVEARHPDEGGRGECLFSHKERKGHKGGKWNGSGAERSCVLLARQRLKVVLLEVLDSAEESIFRFRD